MKTKLEKIKSSTELPMNWYRFIIFVLFPLYVLGNLDLAISEDTTFVGIEGNILLAIFRILFMSVSCYGLYKKFDWSCDLYLLVISLDMFITLSASGVSLFLILIILFIYMYPQSVYFSKREHLFTNTTSLEKSKKNNIKK